jgi:hypothetical protein
MFSQDYGDKNKFFFQTPLISPVGIVLSSCRLIRYCCSQILSSHPKMLGTHLIRMFKKEKEAELSDAIMFMF